VQHVELCAGREPGRQFERPQGVGRKVHRHQHPPVAARRAAPHHQHKAAHAPQQALGRRAECQVADRVPPLRAQHEQVGARGGARQRVHDVAPGKARGEHGAGTRLHLGRDLREARAQRAARARHP
jgi:hypothetical protein